MKKTDANSIAAQKRPTPVTDLGAADAAAQQAAEVGALAGDAAQRHQAQGIRPCQCRLAAGRSDN